MNSKVKIRFGIGLVLLILSITFLNKGALLLGGLCFATLIILIYIWCTEFRKGKQRAEYEREEWIQSFLNSSDISLFGKPETYFEVKNSDTPTFLSPNNITYIIFFNEIASAIFVNYENGKKNFVHYEDIIDANISNSILPISKTKLVRGSEGFTVNPGQGIELHYITISFNSMRMPSISYYSTESNLERLRHCFRIAKKIEITEEILNKRKIANV